MPAVQLSEGMNNADSSSNPASPDVSPDIDSIANGEKGSENKAATTNEEPLKENEETEWIDILGSGQLKMKTLKQGEPDTRPQPNDVCEIKLKGTLEDGKIVDSYDSLKIQLGYHEVVQGVELAIPLMNVGAEALVIVAPRFGYGSIGNLNDIPPDATITYSITLINSSPEPNLEEIPFEERKTLASSKKERGNWWYSRQDSTKAIQCYRKALDILDETVAFCNEEGNSIEYSEKEMKEVIEQKLVIYNNLAAAQLTIKAYESALMSVNRVLQCNPKNVKALFRKGKILKAKGQLNEAVEILRQAFLLEPENNAIKVELSNCVKLQKTEKQHEKKLYQKMFGQDKKDDKSVKSKKRKSSLWTKVLSTAATATVMAGIAFAVCNKFKNYSFL